MRNLKRIMCIFMIALLMVSFMSVNVFAEGEGGGAGGDWKNVDQFDDYGDDDLNSKATTIVGAIVSVVRIVAVGVAIIMLAFVAMKYMSAAPGDRAEIKKHAVIYVVGALVLFGGSGILGIIQNFADNI